ncbi:TPA: phage repressor protein CI [Klebsiella pneumoniae]|uniref:phage repressor protein CI n=1 Tax=Klebsiella pneumoniae TaxID=573 RepID=UPI00206A0840|nr:MAG TPA: CI repressor [Caudoviricetes sp.]HBR2849596.1 phage repressor protein CI [Klebsiella pneumoniae]HBR3018513.1 phage repressor protein CI [Klebsiella pneumoniae]HCQ8593667.1 phage repressor protein CI [Klebsiella pneumoniae]HDZ9734597.1 phage repressor protein CI [Klebsiella pneumoniae]
MRSIKVGNDSGGREAINRLIKAYNFNSRQQLCDHLSVSKSTMANRYLRDSFPAEWVIQCALETGVSLLWLATGQGDKNDNNAQENSFGFVNQTHIKPLSEVVAPEIDKATLDGGALVDQGKVILDNSLIPHNMTNPWLIHTDDGSYLVDRSGTPPVNGVWLVDIDGIKTIAKLARIPGNRLIVQQGESSFECSLDDIEVVGRAIKVIKSL